MSENNIKQLPLTFEQWAVAKYREASELINPCGTDGNLDTVKLNRVLANFASHFAWAITISEIEDNKLNALKHDHDLWYKGKYNEAARRLREESVGQRLPSQASIDSKIVDLAGDELRIRLERLRTQESRVQIVKGLVKVLDRQASILQTLSSNIRSELFWANGADIKDPNKKVRALMSEAINQDKQEGS